MKSKLSKTRLISNWASEMSELISHSDCETFFNDVLKLAPRSSAPSPAEEGMIYYNDIDKKLYYYNGTTWLQL